jgi:hypothetical protein
MSHPLETRSVRIKLISRNDRLNEKQKNTLVS